MAIAVNALIDGDIDAGDSNFKRTSEEIFPYRHNEWQRFNEMQVCFCPPTIGGNSGI
jgi:hypothetical protein